MTLQLSPACHQKKLRENIEDGEFEEKRDKAISMNALADMQRKN